MHYRMGSFRAKNHSGLQRLVKYSPYPPLVATVLAEGKGIVSGPDFAVGEKGNDEDDAKGA